MLGRASWRCALVAGPWSLLLGLPSAARAWFRDEGRCGRGRLIQVGGRNVDRSVKALSWSWLAGGGQALGTCTYVGPLRSKSENKEDKGCMPVAVGVGTARAQGRLEGTRTWQPPGDREPAAALDSCP